MAIWVSTRPSAIFDHYVPEIQKSLRKWWHCQQNLREFFVSDIDVWGNYEIINGFSECGWVCTFFIGCELIQKVVMIWLIDLRRGSSLLLRYSFAFVIILVTDNIIIRIICMLIQNIARNLSNLLKSVKICKICQNLSKFVKICKICQKEKKKESVLAIRLFIEILPFKTHVLLTWR